MPQAHYSAVLHLQTVWEESTKRSNRCAGPMAWSEERAKVFDTVVGPDLAQARREVLEHNRKDCINKISKVWITYVST